MTYAIYNGLSLPVENKTEAQIKQAVAAFFPEVANAEIYRDADGNYQFRVSGGTKGL